jgi:NDP-sugar pyrophosphorylase family protein
MYPVAILAGGLATRLKTITESMPKALIKINGKPFIFHQLEYLREQGITCVVLCLGHLGEMIKSEVGDGSKFGIKVHYSMDGIAPLGTGGALKKALPLLGNNFFVLYGDSYLPIDFRVIQQAYIQSKKMGLMTVLRNENKWDKSNVEYRNKILISYNKRKSESHMNYIDYGLGVLSSEVFSTCPDNQFLDLADIYRKLSLSSFLAGFEVNQRFYEIGSFNGIVDTENYFLNNGAKK